jgi:hypothetical protein
MLQHVVPKKDFLLPSFAELFFSKEKKRISSGGSEKASLEEGQ